MEHPYWYKLLYYWVNEKRGSGLTLPYLVGAIDYKNQNDSYNRSISQYIQEFLATETSSCVVIKHCPMINEIVFGLVDKEKQFSTGQYITPNFYIALSLLDKFQSEQELVEYCNEKYSSLIANKTYSLNGTRWELFIDSDYYMFDIVDSFQIE
jgi:hypothetical protein